VKAQQVLPWVAPVAGSASLKPKVVKLRALNSPALE
jgi:hypothetical protein